MTHELELYVVLKPGKWGWSHPRVDRTTKKAPELARGEVAVKLVLQVPDTILQPTFTLPVVIDASKLIHPTPAVKQD